MIGLFPQADPSEPSAEQISTKTPGIFIADMIDPSFNGCIELSNGYLASAACLPSVLEATAERKSARPRSSRLENGFKSPLSTPAPRRRFREPGLRFPVVEIAGFGC